MQSECPRHFHVPLHDDVDWFRVVIVRGVEAREILVRDTGLPGPSVYLLTALGYYVFKCRRISRTAL
jgi:hypothetical protein